MKFTYFGRWHPAGEDGHLAQAEIRRLALQSGPFRPVADDQRPHQQAAHPQQPQYRESDNFQTVSGTFGITRRSVVFVLTEVEIGRKRTDNFAVVGGHAEL